MNKSKCKTKTCKKWHPQLKDIKDESTYRAFTGCKCNSEIITCVIEHDVKPTKINKGIVTVTKEESEMINYILKD